MHPEGSTPLRARPLSELTLAVREHELPIWRVDFADQKNSSYYVSGSTGELVVAARRPQGRARAITPKMIPP